VKYNHLVAHHCAAGARSDEFLIGRPNDETGVVERRRLAVAEFNFWSQYLNASAVKQLGQCLCPQLGRRLDCSSVFRYHNGVGATMHS